jgi:hypothetical protein
MDGRQGRARGLPWQAKEGLELAAKSGITTVKIGPILTRAMAGALASPAVGLANSSAALAHHLSCVSVLLVVLALEAARHIRIPADVFHDLRIDA